MLHIPSPELSKKPFILVVDDIAENLQVVGSLLRVRGYDVAIAQSGLQALQALEWDTGLDIAGYPNARNEWL